VNSLENRQLSLIANQFLITNQSWLNW